MGKHKTRDPALEARSCKLPLRSKSAKPRAFLNETGLYDYAVKALSRRMRTEADLRRLMHTHIEPGERGEQIVAAVVKRLSEHGYLDDVAYAETYARLRQENEKFGARRVRQDLRQKGVPAELADQTIEARYGGTNEEALARAHLERKRIAKPTDQKETARVVRRLVTAGFSIATIYKILRQWNVPDEALVELDHVEDGAAEE